MSSSIDKYKRLEEERKAFLLNLKPRVYVDSIDFCHVVKVNARISFSDCDLDDFVDAIIKQLKRKVELHKKIYEIRTRQLQFDLEELKSLENELKQ